MNLTPKQLKIYGYLCSYVEENGYSPTLQEIASQFGVSTVTIFEHLNALEAKGAIKRHKHKTRSIEVLDEHHKMKMPVKGTIAAGVPIEAIQERETLQLEELFELDKNPYVLKVRGVSMIDEHICDGDYVVVEPRQWARDGETVVALVNGFETTLKKYYREGDGIRLQPANEDMEPIYSKDVVVQGVVIGIIRKQQ